VFSVINASLDRKNRNNIVSHTGPQQLIKRSPLVADMGLVTDEIKEVTTSIIPIIMVIFVLQIFVLHDSIEQLLMFGVCVILVLIGFTMFLCGVKIGINPMGTAMGMEIPKRKSKLFMIIVVFAISFLVTIAEPDVTVFASQVNSLYPNVSSDVLTYAIAIGVALFLIIASFKIVYKLSLKALLAVSYIIIIGLTIVLFCLDRTAFLAVAYDSGGVTTGPVTVPVLLALGIGICSVGASKNKMDGFGMIGLASAGPILCLLIMGFFTGDSKAVGVESNATEITMNLLIYELEDSIVSVLRSLIPLIIFFAIFQKIFLTYSWNAVRKMIQGLALAGVGIILFLTGVFTGFMPTATLLGNTLVFYNPIMVIILGFLLGFLVAFAEPAVAVLGDQVEETSGGIIQKKTIIMVISFGVASLVALGMAKILYDLSFVYIIVPGYAIAIILMLFSDKDMVGIAFDAGGVSTGPMSVSILSSMYIGMASTLYSGPIAVLYGFGLIALIALAPCIFLSGMGVYIRIKKDRRAKQYGS
jgi:hypothetical protein